MEWHRVRPGAQFPSASTARWSQCPPAECRCKKSRLLWLHASLFASLPPIVVCFAPTALIANRTSGWVAVKPDLGRRRVPSNPAEMGETKSRAVFQAVAERAVDADMRQPDHRDGKHERRGKRKSGGHQCHRRHVAVRGVIDDGAWPRACKIAQEAQIGCQKEAGVNPPRSIPNRVKQRHPRKQRQALQPEQRSHAAGDGACDLCTCDISHGVASVKAADISCARCPTCFIICAGRLRCRPSSMNSRSATKRRKPVLPDVSVF